MDEEYLSRMPYVPLKRSLSVSNNVTESIARSSVTEDSTQGAVTEDNVAPALSVDTVQLNLDPVGDWGFTKSTFTATHEGQLGNADVYKQYNWHLPDDLDDTQDLEIDLMYYLGGGNTSETTRWKVSYAFQAEGEARKTAFDGTVYLQSTSPGTSYYPKHETLTIPNSAISSSDHYVMLEFGRNGTHADDGSSVNSYLMSTSIKYQSTKTAASHNHNVAVANHDHNVTLGFHDHNTGVVSSIEELHPGETF